MIKDALQGIADAITSEQFSKLFIMSTIMFFLGILVGVTIVDTNIKK